jgi:imidazolonepropionase-like amidohydrolase
MLAIRAEALFDGVGPDLVRQPTVLIEGGRIMAVQTRADPPDAARLLDFPGATLLPGMVDTHTHLCFDAGEDVVGSIDGAPAEKVLAAMRTAAEATLAAGVTTVRDLGDRDYLALRLRAEEGYPLYGPQILAAGPPITVPGGHCWFLGGVAAGVDGVRNAVREHVERGVDVIKVMVTGGDLTPGSDAFALQYRPAELRAAVEEAHRYGLPITGHAHAVSGIAAAIAAGFDSIEHCFFRTVDGLDFDDEVIDEMARKGVVASLTLGSLPGPPPPPRFAERLAALAAGLLKLRDAGVRLACGSDSGILPVKPHGSFAYGPAQMVDFGFTAQEALRAVTSDAADACRVGDRKGRIAVGYDADLIAIDGNPLSDITALQRVIHVHQGSSQTNDR